MNKRFSTQQISRTSNLDSNLISRQFKLKILADFMGLKMKIQKWNNQK